MRTIAALLLLTGLATASAACQSDAKKTRCQEIYAKAQAKAQSEGKANHFDSRPEAKASFILKCRDLPEEVQACLDVATSAGPTCKELRKQHQVPVPFGLE
jgi:hypothetical protein